MINLNLTIPDLFLRAVNAHPQEPALWFKVEDQFVAKTWQALADEIARAIAILDGYNLSPGERVVQISENRWEWIVLDLACHFTGLIHVPLHASLGGAQLANQIAHSEARLGVVSNAQQWQKVSAVKSQLPVDIRFVAYDTVADEQVEAWDKLLKRGRSGELLPRNVTPDTIATIMYTSGTTGDAKGVMLTQRNFSSNAQGAVEIYGPAPQELKFNVLPLSHAYARTCDLYLWLARGSQLALAESRDTLLHDLQAVKPTTMNAVPYIYDRMWRVLSERKLDHTPNSLRALLGGNIRTCCAGGAPLSLGLLEFFAQQGVHLLEGYGLTETSPIIAISTRERVRPGSCGPLLPGVEVRIAEDGEVQTRGPHVMAGYFRNEQATAEVLREGWFYTGDLGEIDSDNFLYIRGRKKELIVLATGKKVIPSTIEQTFANDPLISQIVVLGEGRNYLSALVVPQDKCVSALHEMEQHVRTKLSHFSPHEQVRRVALLPDPFTVERGELTLKLSYCRSVIARLHAATIDALYEREA